MVQPILASSRVCSAGPTRVTLDGNVKRGGRGYASSSPFYDWGKSRVGRLYITTAYLIPSCPYSHSDALAQTSSMARCPSIPRLAPSKMVEQIGSAEGIDKAKSLLLLSIRSTCHGSEKMSYADSRIPTIGNQAGGSAISTSAASDLRSIIFPNVNSIPHCVV